MRSEPELDVRQVTGADKLRLEDQSVPIDVFDFRFIMIVRDVPAIGSVFQTGLHSERQSPDNLPVEILSSILHESV